MSIVYFTDRDLGKQFPEVLRTAGLAVERHDDHFAHDTQDEAWLAEVGQRGWIAITHDARIRFARQRPPFIAKLYRSPKPSSTASGLLPGRVELWYP